MDDIFDKQFAAKLRKDRNQPMSDSTAKLTIIRTKYATDYMLFLRNMLKVYQKNSSINRELIGAAKLVQTVIILLDTAMGKKGRPATDEEAALLKIKMDETNAQMQYFSKLYGESKRFKSVVDKIAQDTGLTLQHLTAVSGDLLKEVGSITPENESLTDKLKRTAPSIARLGDDFRRDFINQALGPFAPIGNLAWEAFTGIRRGVREKRTLRERQRYAQSFGPIGMDVTGEAAESVRGRRGMGAGIGGVFEDVRGGGGGFEGFFNQKAYQTRWTKEVVESLRKMSGKKSDGSAEGEGMMSMLVSKVLGPTLAIIGAGIAGSLAGGFINKKVGDIVGPDNWKNFNNSLWSGGAMGGGTANTIWKNSLPGSVMRGLGTMLGTVPQTPQMTVENMIYMKKKGIKAEDLGLSGSSEFAYNNAGVIKAIEDAFKNIGGKVSSAMNTLVVPKEHKTSPYKAADPLIDDLNKTGS